MTEFEEISQVKYDNSFTPFRFSTRFKLDDDETVISGRLGDKEISLTIAHAGDVTVKKTPLKKGMVTPFGLMRIVTLLPRQSGKTYEVSGFWDMISSGNVNIQPDKLIECLGADPKAGPKDRPWTKFVFRDRMKTKNSKAIHCWVDDQNVLRKIADEEQTNIIELIEEAKPADPKP